MKRNGFTLIELLAVIVILAIIALIATPIILGIISDAKEKADERSVELYASAVRNAVAAYQLTGTSAPKSFDDLTIQYDGDVECSVEELYEDGSFYLEGCKVNGGEKEYSYGTKQGLPSASVWEQEGNTIYGKTSEGEIIYTILVGDQIAYDAYTGVDSSMLSYTATIELTGNTNTNNETLYGNGTVDEENKVYQVKSSDINRIWNVLGVEDGKLLITTSVLDKTLILAKKTGYDNAITVLNNISAIYGHGVGAEYGRSINSEDVTKVTGIEITTPTFDDGGTAVWQIGTFDSSTTKNILVGNYFVADTRGWSYPGPGDYVSSILAVSSASDSIGTIEWYDLVWDNFGNYVTSDSIKPVVILKTDLILEKDKTTNIWNIK